MKAMIANQDIYHTLEKEFSLLICVGIRKGIKEFLTSETRVLQLQTYAPWKK